MNKSFKTSFDDLITKKPEIRERSLKKTQIAQETKATFVIKCTQLDKIKAISYLERKMIKEVLFDAIAEYILKYENTNGEVITPRR